MATDTLFEVPVLDTVSPEGNPPTGKITCTTPSAGVYLLTFNAPPDNRLTTQFCQAVLLALDILEFSHPTGVLMTTSAITKFYSNGLDLNHATSTPGFFSSSLYAMFKRFLTYPMPTVALVNGHAFAGGFMTAMYHDYRIFNPSRGFLCLNELDLGVPLRPAMSSIFRQKLTPAVYKVMVIEARRFGAKEALDSGIVDGLGGLQEALKFIEERKLVTKGSTGVYGDLKAEMFRETVGYLDGDEREEERSRGLYKIEDQRRKEGNRRVDEWKRSKSGAKL
ncbi:uncharacterized protein BP5553_05941 [Venustampulla echinocandica]|uniref:ClpP n=1 Tax=Venustampulla echinocandica TaxID=2656787 RepID=A0A370TM53_9HELO|nr:uncharacterized protein BP5553_05941 [Venustampulla echinocandica]RDL36589.1 hypothetical protein BP5553_05941 [Venustampulla echinocandica]